MSAAPVKARGRFFDTFINITAYGASKELLKEAFAMCSEYNSALSRFEKGSDVWLLNNAGGKAVTVGPDTAEIIKTALEISRLTGGAFDISIGSASSLWNFTDGKEQLPDEAALEKAAASANYESIVCKGSSAVLAPGQKIDLGGIAKGYIAGEIAAHLKDNGVESAILDFGGDIVTIGSKPDGTPWSVGLRRPFAEDPDEIWALLPSADEAIVTSGTDRRGFDHAGSWQHHILDRLTGKPVVNDLLSVTVCADDPMRADALATAFFVLGEKDGPPLARELGVGAVFLKNDGSAVCTPDIVERLRIVKK
ncbi:MAG: FAD:protein FMN transferase [Oscillospiraceae bacterium]|nr:FAD:protein FMN transferase [Oscillospiraceae bacterium]